MKQKQKEKTDLVYKNVENKSELKLATIKHVKKSKRIKLKIRKGIKAYEQQLDKSKN